MLVHPWACAEPQGWALGLSDANTNAWASFGLGGCLLLTI